MPASKLSSVVFDYQSQLAEQGIATALSARMLSDSVQYLDRLAQVRPADPDLVIELASGYLKMASVQAVPRSAKVGDRAGALASLAKARVLLEDLQRRRPSYAPAQLWLGLLSCQRGLLEDAEAPEYVRDCLSKLEELGALFSQSTERFEGLGHGYSRQADLAPHPRQAVELRKRALECFESAARLGGDSLPRRGELASQLRYLSMDHAKAGDLDSMGRSVRRALQLDEERLKAQPDSAAIQFAIAFDLGLLGEHATRRGALPEALAYYERTLELRRQVLQSDPGNALVQHRYFLALNSIARVKRMMGDVAAARLAYRQAIDALARLPAAGSDPIWHVAIGQVYAGYGLLLSESPAERSEGCSWLRQALEQWQKTSNMRGSLIQLRDGEKETVEKGLAERCVSPHLRPARQASTLVR
jgi:tetratricopeptide (TPR) repeat protein